MTAVISKRWIVLFIPFLLLVSLACNVLTGILPGSSGSNGVTVHENVTFGSGPVNLPDLKVGLSDLPSYTATLTISFVGTQNGQVQRWSRKYVMLASKQSALRQLTLVDMSGSSIVQSVYMAELNGADYVVRGQDTCTASVIEQGNSLSEQGEPASFLHYVIGADEAGSETVNGVAANHYKFDESALGEQNQNQSAGEVWVATSGGYVVKYLLTTKAKADYFGDGIEGTLTSDYELTDVGKPVKIQLPATCPGGMIDVPKLPDASNADNEPGTLIYNTSATVADAAAFYQKQLPALGWILQRQAEVTNGKALINFSKDNLSMSIFITPGAGTTTVNVTLMRAQK